MKRSNSPRSYYCGMERKRHRPAAGGKAAAEDDACAVSRILARRTVACRSV